MFIIVQMAGSVQDPCSVLCTILQRALVFFELLVSGGLDLRPDAVDVGAHQGLAVGVGVQAVEGVLRRQQAILCRDGCGHVDVGMRADVGVDCVEALLPVVSGRLLKDVVDVVGVDGRQRREIGRMPFSRQRWRMDSRSAMTASVSSPARRLLLPVMMMR